MSSSFRTATRTQRQIAARPAGASCLRHHLTLAERFSQMVGLAPMQYLTEWRLQLAAEQLSGGSKKIAAVAADVGYESEAAFSRAFKRSTGMSPAAWRKARQGGGSAA